MAQMIADHVALTKFSKDLSKLAEDLNKRKADADSKIKKLGETYKDVTFKEFEIKYNEGMKRVPRLSQEIESYSKHINKLVPVIIKHLNTKF